MTHPVHCRFLLNSVGYDLTSRILPNPNQVIRLELVLPEVEETVEEIDDLPLRPWEPTPTPTPEPTPLPSFNVGDTITIRTWPIVDHNQNIVPDGTIVRFNFRISGEPGITQQFESPTSGGIAFFNYRIEAAGGMEITASSAPATQSETLQINISPKGSCPSLLSRPRQPSLRHQSPHQLQRSHQPWQPTPTSTPSPFWWTIPHWVIGLWCARDGVWRCPDLLDRLLWWGSSRWGLRSSLCALIGGLLSYSYLNLGLMGQSSGWINPARYL
jgi:beta-N-acetylhexosaminidase